MADFIVTKAFMERAGFCGAILDEFVNSFGEDGQINLSDEDTRELFEQWVNQGENAELAEKEKWMSIFDDFKSSAAAIAEFGYPEEYETDEWVLTNPLNGEIEIYNTIDQCSERRIQIIKQYIDINDMVSVSKKWITEDGHEVVRPLSPQDQLDLFGKCNVEAEKTTE